MRSMAVRVRSGIVRHRLDRRQVRAGREGERRDRVGVCVPDAARPLRVPWFEQLVTGGQHREPRSPGAAHLPHADRGNHAELRGAQRGAALQHRDPGLDVIAGMPHVVPFGDLRPNLHPAVKRAGVLHSHDRVGSIGDHGARGDRNRLTISDRPGGGPAGAGLVDDEQARRLFCGGSPDVPGPDGKSVHGGIVEAGHLVCAFDVNSKDAAKCLAEWHDAPAPGNRRARARGAVHRQSRSVCPRSPASARLHSTASITSLAFTSAVTSLPGAIPSSRTASTVIEATSLIPLRRAPRSRWPRPR